jgi:hypothetical protein
MCDSVPKAFGKARYLDIRVKLGGIKSEKDKYRKIIQVSGTRHD